MFSLLLEVFALRSCWCFLVVATVVMFSYETAWAQPFHDTPSLDNPAVATYDGGVLTLRNLEDYAAESAKLERVPRLSAGQAWREHMARELAKEVLFTSQALAQNLHLDPSLLRARNYYIQEWMSYAILRDNVVNKIEVSVPKLREFYETHRQDYFITSTVSLRVIRTRDKAKAEKAMERIRSGEQFRKVEMELSEVSLRERGKVLGPFPSTTTVSMIPPPPEVIKAGKITPVGQTTGPLFIRGNYFIVKTVDRTPDHQVPFEDAVEFVETRVRQSQGDDLTRKLLADLRSELMVEENDDAINDPKTQPNDIIATVGTVLVPYGEYKDLNGVVRGPAINAANLEPTRLSRFLVPTIFQQAGFIRGYQDHADFKRALLFHDLKRFGQRALDMEVDRQTPVVTESEIRKQYEIARKTKDEDGHYMTEPYERVRDMIRDAMYQQKRGDTEARIAKQVIDNAHVKLVSPIETTQLTAFEAAVAAEKEIPAHYRIRMITTMPVPGSASAEQFSPTILTEAGRRKQWLISLENDQNASDTRKIIWDKPGRMFDASDYFLSSTVYMQWGGIWRFDTDALIRNGLDNGMVDFMTKHDDNVHVNSRVEFQYDGKMPKSCYVVYEMIPLDKREEVLTLRYSGDEGSLSRKPLHECEPCEQMKRLLNEPF
jgi:hypothetical protein